MNWFYPAFMIVLGAWITAATLGVFALVGGWIVSREMDGKA